MLGETYFDQDMKVVRRMTTDKVGKIGGREYPVTMTMKPADEAGQMDAHRNHVRHSSTSAIPGYLFTLSNLQNPQELSHGGGAGLAQYLAAAASHGAEPDIHRAGRRHHHLHPVAAAGRLRHDEGKRAAADRRLRAGAAARLCRRSRSAQDHRRSGRADGAARQDSRRSRPRAPRATTYVILSNGPRSYGAAVFGIDPAREAKVSTLGDTVVEGPLSEAGRQRQRS